MKAFIRKLNLKKTLQRSPVTRVKTMLLLLQTSCSPKNGSQNRSKREYFKEFFRINRMRKFLRKWHHILERKKGGVQDKDFSNTWMSTSQDSTSDKNRQYYLFKRRNYSLVKPSLTLVLAQFCGMLSAKILPLSCLRERKQRISGFQRKH